MIRVTIHKSQSDVCTPTNIPELPKPPGIPPQASRAVCTFARAAATSGGSICSRPGLWTICRTTLWRRSASAKGALKGSDEDLRNGPIATAVNSDRFWLVRVRRPTHVMGRGALRLEAQWRSPEVVFPARGIGPLTLAYGNGSISGAESALAPLPISVTPALAILAAPWTLGGAERQKARSETLPWKTSILWAALLAGVALLAGMESAARRILSGCARPRPPEVRAGHSRRFKPRPAQGRFALGSALPGTYSARRASQSALLANLIATVLSAESRPNA